jgi:hypothetical protein
VATGTIEEADVLLTTAVETERAQVVRDTSGRVILICWGDDAAAVGAGWTARGYHVVSVDRGALGV